MILERFSERTVSTFIENGIITGEDKELYVYGLYQGIILLINLVSSLIIGILFGMVWQTVVFMVFYAPIRIYAAGEDLYGDMLSGEYFDIIFLGIELKEIDGIEVGRRIRDELNNNLVQIIYISSLSKYAQQLLIARSIQFLVKPFDESRIEAMLSKALYLIQYQEYFTYQVNKSYHKVPVNNILYFRSLQNRVEMVCSDQSVVFYASLASIYEKLRENHFFIVIDLIL